MGKKISRTVNILEQEIEEALDEYRIDIPESLDKQIENLRKLGKAITKQEKSEYRRPHKTTSLDTDLECITSGPRRTTTTKMRNGYTKWLDSAWMTGKRTIMILLIRMLLAM